MFIISLSVVSLVFHPLWSIFLSFPRHFTCLSRLVFVKCQTALRPSRIARLPTRNNSPNCPFRLSTQFTGRTLSLPPPPFFLCLSFGLPVLFCKDFFFFLLANPGRGICSCICGVVIASEMVLNCLFSGRIGYSSFWGSF